MGTNSVDAQRHSDEMSAQRAKALAGDEKHYKLRKACAVRAVELYNMLRIARSRVIDDIDTEEPIDQLLKEIDHAAE